MTMLDVFKKRVKNFPEVTDVKVKKEYSSKYKLLVTVFGEEVEAELHKESTPGGHNRLCDYTIIVACCSALMRQERLVEAKTYMDRISELH